MKQIYLLLSTSLVLAACGGVDYLKDDDHFEMEYVEIEPEPTPEAAPEPTLTPEYESEPTPAPEPTPQPIALEHPVWEISEYGRQVAKEFLSQMTSIFSHGEVYWEWGALDITPGLYILGWNAETRQPFTTDVAPKVVLNRFTATIYDSYGNRIYDAPWMPPARHDC